MFSHSPLQQIIISSICNCVYLCGNNNLHQNQSWSPTRGDLPYSTPYGKHFWSSLSIPSSYFQEWSSVENHMKMEKRAPWWIQYQNTLFLAVSSCMNVITRFQITAIGRRTENNHQSRFWPRIIFFCSRRALKHFDIISSTLKCHFMFDSSIGFSLCRLRGRVTRQLHAKPYSCIGSGTLHTHFGKILIKENHCITISIGGSR